jgi:hypothetical protein
MLVLAKLTAIETTILVTPKPETSLLVLIMAEQNAISLKLPTFKTSQPQAWLAQAEAHFQLRKIMHF